MVLQLTPGHRTCLLDDPDKLVGKFPTRGLWEPALGPAHHIDKGNAGDVGAPRHVIEMYPRPRPGSPGGPDCRQSHRHLRNPPEIGLLAHIVRELALNPLGELVIAILRRTIGPRQDVWVEMHFWIVEPRGRERVSVPAIELGEPGGE